MSSLQVTQEPIKNLQVAPQVQEVHYAHRCTPPSTRLTAGDIFGAIAPFLLLIAFAATIIVCTQSHAHESTNQVKQRLEKNIP